MKFGAMNKIGMGLLGIGKSTRSKKIVKYLSSVSKIFEAPIRSP
jgi:hypothetical protein